MVLWYVTFNSSALLYSYEVIATKKDKEFRVVKIIKKHKNNHMLEIGAPIGKTKNTTLKYMGCGDIEDIEKDFPEYFIWGEKVTFDFLKEHIGDIFRLSFQSDRFNNSNGWVIIASFVKIKEQKALFKPLILVEKGNLSEHSIKSLYDEDTYIRYIDKESFIDVKYIGKSEDFPEYFI